MPWRPARRGWQGCDQKTRPGCPGWVHLTRRQSAASAAFSIALGRAVKHSCPLTSRPSPCCPGTAKPRSSLAAVRVRSRPGSAAPGVPPGRFDPVALVRDHHQRAARLQKTAHMIGIIEAQRQAMRLSPLDPNNQDWKRVLLFGLMLAGRHDEVMEWIDESLHERPNHLGTIHCKLTLCGYFGRVDEGRAWARRLLEANPAMTIAGFEAYGAKFLVPGDIRFGLRVSVGPGCLKDDDLDQSPCRSPRRGCRRHSAGVGACQPGTPGYAANHGIWRGPMSDCDSTTSTVAGCDAFVSAEALVSELPHLYKCWLIEILRTTL
jgi:hypothetical protein